MFNKARQSKTTYGIVGLGRFGSALALELIRSGAEILVVDHDEEKIREMREYTENVFVAHSYDKKALAETGIQNCDVAVVCIGEHLDTSILTTLNLVGMKIFLFFAAAKKVFMHLINGWRNNNKVVRILIIQNPHFLLITASYLFLW